MAREIAEVPAAAERLLSRRANVIAAARTIREFDPRFVVICGRGSSGHVGTFLRYLIEVRAGLLVSFAAPSVVTTYRRTHDMRQILFVVISQSGRSPDILAFQAEAKRAGIPTLAVTNTEDSPLAREADLCLPLCAGPERSVAATKTFIASAAMAAALVAACGGDARFAQAVEKLPEDLDRALAIRWSEMEEAFAPATSAYVLGRGPSLPMAQEAALKLKETSGLHAEAYSAAEVIHGPMELVGPGFPVVVLAPEDKAFATTADTARRLAEAGAHVMTPDFARTSDPLLDPIAMIQSFYGSAERIARARKRDPDKPRLLKKVTETR